jgi:hypothetical protein
MSGNTPRKKRSSALLEESSAKLVKTAPKKQAKMSNRSRPTIKRTGRAEKPSRYKSGSKSITSSNLQAMVTANSSPAIVRRKLKNGNGLVLEKTAFCLTVREITQDLQSECKWQGSALEDLRKVAEDHVVRTLAGQYRFQPIV